MSTFRASRGPAYEAVGSPTPTSRSTSPFASRPTSITTTRTAFLNLFFERPFHRAARTRRTCGRPSTTVSGRDARPACEGRPRLRAYGRLDMRPRARTSAAMVPLSYIREPHAGLEARPRRLRPPAPGARPRDRVHQALAALHRCTQTSAVSERDPRWRIADLDCLAHSPVAGSMPGDRADRPGSPPTRRWLPTATPTGLSPTVDLLRGRRSCPGRAG